MAVAVRLAPGASSSLLTVAQRDEWRTYLDVPSTAVSAGGRYIAFTSYAPLVPADTNRRRDIYVLDRTDGSVSLESVTPDGHTGDCDSAHPSISADGHLVVYETGVSCWTATAPPAPIVLRNRRDSTTVVIGADATSPSGEGWSHSPVISADGRFVAFVSSANPAHTPDANGIGEDVYLFDVATGLTRRVSVNDAGVQPPVGHSVAPSISGDGRFVAFASAAPLHQEAARPAVSADGRRRLTPHVYVRDTRLNVTRLVSRLSGGAAGNAASWNPSIDAGGRTVAFVSAATNLTSADRNRAADVFVADLQSGLIELISRSARGGCANGPSGAPVLSADGRFVAFQSEGSDLVCASACPRVIEDINLLWDVFLFDRQTRIVTRVSGDAAGGWMEASVGPGLDATGTVVAFSSRHPIDARDTRNDFDLFVRTPLNGR